MNEKFEVALSDDGTTYSEFQVFEPGDVRDLSPYVKFRVTVFGDFDIDDYRLRGFSGIAADATLTEGGFGISPFGRFPFGDGGVCFDDENTVLEPGLLHLSGTLIAQQGFGVSGSMSMSGSLVVGVFESGTMSMSGTLSAEPLVALSGSMSMSGSLAALVKESLSGSMSMSGNLNADSSNELDGTLSMSGSLAVHVAAAESGSMSMDGSLVIGAIESGSMSMSGSLAVLVTAAESGSMSMSGTLSAGAFESGSLTLDGTLVGTLLAQGSVIVSNLAANNNITPTSTNIFFPWLDPTTTTATVGNAQIRLPIAITATRMMGVLNTRPNNGASWSIRLNINGSGNNGLLMTAASAAAPTAALAGAGAGNVNNGTHGYSVTFIINGFEQCFGAVATVSVVNNATNGQVSLTSIATGPTGTTARKIYRTVAGAATALPANIANYKLLTTINDNSTTTFTDNVADGSLGAATLLNVPIPIGSASGSVSMAQDDLVCWEATNFVTDTTATILNVALAYSAALADGFVYSPSVRAYIAGQTNTIGLTTKGGSGAALGYVPKQLTLNFGTMKCDTAPGAGASYTMTPKVNNVGVGSALSVAGTNTSSRTTVNGVLPASVAGNVDTTKANTNTEGSTGAPANTGNMRVAYSYKVDSPNGDIAFFNTGQAVFNWTVGATTLFPAIGRYDVASAPPSTESASWVIWPLTGTFKFLMVDAIIPNGTTVDVHLRINGSNVITVSCVGTGAEKIYTELVTTAAVSAGDKVNFAYERSAGAGTTFQAAFVIGYTNS